MNVTDCRELSRAEYFDTLGFTGDENIRRAVMFWNAAHPTDKIHIVNCFKSGRPIIHRSALPQLLRERLERNEANGVRYVGGGEYAA